MANPPVSTWDPDFAFFLKSVVFGPGLFAFALLVLPALGARLAGHRGRSPRAWALGFAASAILVFYCSSFGAKLVAAPLRKNSEITAQADPGCVERAKAVVMLGGGIVNEQLPSPSSMIRLQRAAELLNDTPVGKRPSVVVLSGGDTLLDNGVLIPEALVYERFLRLLLKPSVAADLKILREEASQNTYENAAFTRRILDAQGIAPDAIVVTTSEHMTRALAVFQREGFATCALPATNRRNRRALPFSFSNAMATQESLNEWIGYLGYRLRGWI